MEVYKMKVLKIIIFLLTLTFLILILSGCNAINQTEKNYQDLKEELKRAGITKRVGCHILRHSFALNFYKNSDHDLVSLQRTLGHKNINTTTIYAYMDRTAVKANPCRRTTRPASLIPRRNTN